MVDGYGVKLLTSGYNLDHTRRILINMKYFVAKVARRKQRWGRIHLTAEKGAQVRHRKRLQNESSKTTKGAIGEFTPKKPWIRTWSGGQYCLWSSLLWGS